MKSIILALALLATPAYAQQDLGRDILEKKQLVEAHALPNAYRVILSAHVRHEKDEVDIHYTDKGKALGLHGFITESSYIATIGIDKKATILVTAQRLGAHDVSLIKILDEQGVPDSSISHILLHDAINKANGSIDAVLLRSHDSFLVIANIPNGSEYKDGKWILSKQDKDDTAVAHAIAAYLKQQYKLE